MHNQVSRKNVVIHSENCKVEIPWTKQHNNYLKKNCRMTGFTDCSTEMFHVDYIEPGYPRNLNLSF